MDSLLLDYKIIDSKKLKRWNLGKKLFYDFGSTYIGLLRLYRLL